MITGRTAFAIICAVLVAVLVVVQGFRHHWRTSPIGGLRDCTTGEELDDGCSMFGVCTKCESACAPGTAPDLGPGRVALSTHRCGT